MVPGLGVEPRLRPPIGVVPSRHSSQCRRQGSNLPALSSTATSRLRVCQIHHGGMNPRVREGSRSDWNRTSLILLPKQVPGPLGYTPMIIDKSWKGRFGPPLPGLHSGRRGTPPQTLERAARGLVAGDEVASSSFDDGGSSRDRTEFSGFSDPRDHQTRSRPMTIDKVFGETCSFTRCSPAGHSIVASPGGFEPPSRA